MAVAIVNQNFFHTLKNCFLLSLKVTENRSDLEDLHLYVTLWEQRFRRFASLEFEGQLYMTPYDFIQAVTNDEPKRAKKWRSLSKQELNQILMETPPVWKGSSKLFRNLNEKGVISYTEYLFLLCILTKPHAGFRIAFNMFDTDGNEMVDKKEFLVLQEIFRKKNEKREKKGDEEKRAMLVSKIRIVAAGSWFVFFDVGQNCACVYISLITFKFF